MEVLGGLVILLFIWMLGRIMDSKTQDINQKKFELAVNRDPTTIVSHMKQNLRSEKINSRGLRSNGSGKINMKYATESYILLASAQLMAIDLNVNALDVRGPLIGHYRKDFDSEFQSKYEKYKKEFISANRVDQAFAESMGLNGAEMLLLDAAALNESFIKIYKSGINYLRDVGVFE